MQIIKDKKIVDDSFVQVADEEPLPADNVDVIVPLARWQAHRSELTQRSGKVGVRLTSDAEPERLVEDLALLSVVAVEFPKFADGRGYTMARLLRERLGFRGELRAVGNVLRDQMFYMHRCGFNAFEVDEGRSLESALEAFNDFTVTYQPAADEPRPLFRRRGASA